MSGSPSLLTDGTRYVQAVRDAIMEGIHPKMIVKGSSGSYFARAKVDGRIQTVACVLNLLVSGLAYTNGQREFSNRRTKSHMGG